MPKKSSKSFNVLTDKIEKAVGDFTNAAKNNTVFCIMCNKSEYRAFSSGTFHGFSDEEKRKHSERLMMTLMSNRAVFDYLYSIVEPVARYHRREAKKAAKQKITPLNSAK